MLNILSAKEMRNVENYTMNNLGISSPVLMERAALASFNHIINNYNFSNNTKVLVMAGSGNNGGDGIAVARMLLLKDIDVTLCLLGNRERATEQNVNQLHTYLSLDGKSINFNDLSINIDSNKFDLIIDALFGIGLSRNLEGEYLDAVKFINSSNAYIYSLDIPSGINTDTGIVMGDAVKANETFCFSEYKLGLLLNKGPEYCGKVTVFDVGIVESYKITDNNFIHALTKEDINNLLSKRPVIGHKGTFGKILIIAGSSKMAGAALLSSKAAFAAGAGMVKLISSDINREAILSCLPELMYDCSENITDEELNNNFNWADVVIIGPGLSTDENASRLVSYTIKNCDKPLVVDADALNILADNMDLIKIRKEKSFTTVITPHPGEFKRLFNDSNFNNPYDIKNLANEYGITIVAKNTRTIISDGETTFINMSGTSGMGTAGSGDVLTGIIGTFIHNQNSVLSVSLAVFMHGLAGENAAVKKSDYSMTASDIIENLF